MTTDSHVAATPGPCAIGLTSLGLWRPPRWLQTSIGAEIYRRSQVYDAARTTGRTDKH
jgi:hypothetical protein